MKIIKVIVYCTERLIQYSVFCENGNTEEYTDVNVPDSIIKLINRRKPERRIHLIENDMTIYIY